jgi:hypothetical protein
MKILLTAVVAGTVNGGDTINYTTPALLPLNSLGQYLLM